LKTPPNTITGVTVKIAVDTHGGVAEMANATISERFTSEPSLDMVHRLRKDSDAVLVGWKTVQIDNPSLTVRRNVPCPVQPLRVVIDPELKLFQPGCHLQTSNETANFAVFQDGLPTVVYHSVQQSQDNINDWKQTLSDAVTIVHIPQKKQDRKTFLTGVLDHLKDNFKVQHLMVEGGPRTVQTFLQQQLVDRLILVKAPVSFQKPLPSNITTTVLLNTGLRLKHSFTNQGGDVLEYWSRPNLPWPNSTSDETLWP